MNDHAFEDSLRQLRPVAPSPALETRIREELAPSAAPAQPEVRRATVAGVVKTKRPGLEIGRWFRDLGWALAGAATAYVVFTHFSSAPQPLPAPLAVVAPQTAPQAEPEIPADAFEHASATQELVAKEDATEIVETEDGLARPVRYTYVERHTWANARTGARMEIEVPREEYYLRPIALQ